MAKGPPPPWASRDCRFDHLVAAALKQGYGKPVVYHGIETPERAKEIKNGIYRCARHRKISAWVEWTHSGRVTTKSADWPPDKQADGTYSLTFTVASKNAARKRHLEKYGTDRQQWPYNPRQAKTQDDIDAWAERGLDEKGHRVK
jgi:hypothetical protein